MFQNISKYNPLAGSSYIKLPKELSYSRKDFIIIQNAYHNECFKWCLIKYLRPADYHPERNRKIAKLSGDELDFQDMKFLVKIKDINKIEKRILSPLVILIMKIRKNIQSIYQKICYEEKHNGFY